MSAVLLAILLFTLVPGSLALAHARAEPDETYERASIQRAVVLGVLIAAMLVGLGIPGALWYLIRVRRHRRAPEVLPEPLLVRWALNAVALPQTIRTIRRYQLAQRPAQVPRSVRRPLTLIGRIHSRHTDPEQTPIQGALNAEETAEIHIELAYLDALDGLEGFDYVWLLSWLQHQGQPLGSRVPLRQVPFLLRGSGVEQGIFAMRGPQRPTPIGLHLVRLVAVEGPVLRIAGIDLLDGTPIVDIKPYVPAFDTPYGPAADRPRSGWFDETPKQPGTTPALMAARSTG